MQNPTLIIQNISLLLSEITGFFLICIAIIANLKRRNTPVIFVLAGVLLIALPVLDSAKLGPLDLGIRNLQNQVATVQTQVFDLTKKLSIQTEKQAVALVFYGDNAVARAKKIVELLRENDFISSAISTDFSELGKERNQYSPGDAYIRFLPGFKSQAESVEKLLSQIQGINNVKIKPSSSFNAGNLQIGLF